MSAAGTVLSHPTRQTRASKSCACAISSIESAITSREMSEARIPGVACDWLSETAMVLKTSPTPPAASPPSTTRSASSRWFRLHGIVPVHVEAMPTIGPPRRAGSMPIARKCARAGARSAPETSASRARRRRASCTGRVYVGAMVRLGLLSTAGINGAILGPRTSDAPFEIRGAGSRDAPRAQAYAHEHGIERAHGSYDELLSVDGV